MFTFPITHITHKIRVFADEKEVPICTPLYKRKNERAKTQEPQTTAIDLNSIEANLESGIYETVAQFDGEINAVFSNVIREHGRISTLGSVALQLKKVIVINRC